MILYKTMNSINYGCLRQEHFKQVFVIWSQSHHINNTFPVNFFNA
jgi:hypothetical protein